MALHQIILPNNADIRPWHFRLKNVDGVEFEGDRIKFKSENEKFVKSEIRRFNAKFAGGDGFVSRSRMIRKASDLSQDKLDQLQQYAPDLDLSEGVVHAWSTTNTLLDSDGDMMDISFLNHRAKRINDIRLASLWMHNNTWLQGKGFYAEVLPIDKLPGNYELIEYHHILPKTTLPNRPEYTTNELIAKGEISHLSIGFVGSGDWVDNPHRGKDQPKRAFKFSVDWDDADSVHFTDHPETSMVYRGSNRGAHIKSADVNIEWQPIEMQPSKIKKPNEVKMINEYFNIGGDRYDVKFSSEGDFDSAHKQLDELRDAIMDHIAAKDAEISALKKEKEIAEKAVNDLKEPIALRIIKRQDSMNVDEVLRYKEDTLKAMELGQLEAIDSAIEKKWKAENKAFEKIEDKQKEINKGQL